MHGLKLYLAILSLLSRASGAEVVSRTIDIRHVGKIRYHFYDDPSAWNATSSSSPGCDTVLLLGVGTAMGVGDYDMLSHNVVTATNRIRSSSSSILMIVMDHNPLWLVKTDAQKYANLASTIVRDIATLVPICSNKSRNGFVIGGHSASGQAAMDALGRNLFLNFKPIGLFGLDPFDATTVATVSDIDIPVMYWGFTKTTCDVNVAKAAEYAYNHTSNPKRVLYQVDNANRDGGTIVTHCIFTDHGCGGAAGLVVVCPAHVSDGWVRTEVGDSARRFVTALKSGDFGRSHFVLNNDDNSNDNGNNTTSKRSIHLFVGRESPKDEPTGPIKMRAVSIES
jgi:hypothetical protein